MGERVNLQNCARTPISYTTTVRPRSLNPGKALAMAICPIICLFHDLARALVLDVACEFACAVTMRRNN